MKWLGRTSGFFSSTQLVEKPEKENDRRSLFSVDRHDRRFVECLLSENFNLFCWMFSCLWDRLVWLSGSGIRLESGRSRVGIPFVPGFLRGRVIPVASNSALQWLPCQAPGIAGSVLKLVSLVSVYCDWVRWKVWSATSISVWQYVKLSDQIRP